MPLILAASFENEIYICILLPLQYMKFSHLHVHTQYSLLDGASSIKSLLQKAVHDKMPAVAITDHGNLFGVFEFVAETYKIAKTTGHAIKPIIGCEFYLTQDATIKAKGVKQYHQLLLAKNEIGYKNLLALSHFSYATGFYRKPMIDKTILLQHKEGLIASSCCLASIVAQTLAEKGEAAAEVELKWWIDIFGADYYLELQRHGLQKQEVLNNFLICMAKKYNTKLICTNDSHYTDQNFAPLHEILLCINTGSLMTDPKRDDESLDEEQTITNDGGKKVRPRFAFSNDKFFFKTTAEMQAIFPEQIEALDNTNEIVDKVQPLRLERDIMLPSFPLPEGFSSQHTYLRHLAELGLRRKYTIITPAVQERFEFELGVIEKMDYSGYFLIVADFIKAAKEIGVAVGPGRGSAAGSLIAYAMDITNVDPIQYNLLFERFLNPERRGMPDIDIDFDDIGRDKVLDYIVRRYGKNHTAQIITYNTMGAKGAFKDVARVHEYDFQQSNQISKWISSDTSLKRQLEAQLHDTEDSLEKQDSLSANQMDNVKKLREKYEHDPQIKKILDIAKELEGSIRNIGVHAAGIIIAPQPVHTMIPVCVVKNNDTLVSQIEGNSIESAGVIKMDILGLSNLAIIQHTLQLIKQHHGKTIDLDDIPLDDEATFKLYQQAETIGTFQFESDGMRKYLQDLRPDSFKDLIALNALYRPGPMKYIPEYIARKYGRKTATYDLPEMESILKETYGITVYQEQVMLIAQVLADFSKGEADVLRKAMGKKDPAALQKLKKDFLTRATAQGHPKNILEKIWEDWQDFAYYAFNKSHSTCYAYVAYQTAYLKANYPHEYMTALLDSAKDIKGQTKIIQETKRMGIRILVPSINESDISFSINDKKEIRFGLASIKGFGQADSQWVVEQRKKYGMFKDVFQFFQYMEGKLGIGKLEALVKAGALDEFHEIQRAQYFIQRAHTSFLEELVQYSKQYGNSTKPSKDENQLSLFSTETQENLVHIPMPKVPFLQEKDKWTNLEKLKFEREILGMYISSHPLENYHFEFNQYGFTKLIELSKLENPVEDDDEEINMDKKLLLNSSLLIGGIVENMQDKITKKGSPFLNFTLSDFSGSHSFTFFEQDYSELKKYIFPDAYIFLQIGFKPDRFDKDKIVIALKKVGRLEDVRPKFTKEIHLHTQQENLTSDVINFISPYIPKKNGNSILYIHFLTAEQQQVSIKIPQPILFDDALAEFLRKSNTIYCKINTSF